MSKKVKSLFRVLLQITGKYEYKKQTLYYIFYQTYYRQNSLHDILNKILFLVIIL